MKLLLAETSDSALSETLVWWNSFVGILPDIVAGIVVMLIFWVVAVIISRVVARVCTVKNFNTPLTALFRKSIKITILLFGLISALGTMGVNVSAMVAGLGLTGFALGFALKDVLSNLLSGVLLMIYRPFRVGNVIEVKGAEQGTVTAIDLRYTTLNTKEDDTVFVPNSILFSNVVTVLGPEKPAEPDKPDSGD